ncbi:hypothetical protein D3C76_1668690 [compost metagenome]
MRHSLADGFRDLPDALTYQSAEGCVRFDKTSGCLTLDPPETDVLGLLVELQALANLQEREERAAMLRRLARRPF